MDKEDKDKTVIASETKLKKLTPKQNKEHMVACLVQYTGGGAGKRYSLVKKENLIGRDPACFITISDLSVSRKHAKIYVGTDTVSVEDLESINGTFINNIKIKKKIALKDQDMIRIGVVLFKFFSQENIDGYIQDKVYKMATIDSGTQTYNKQYTLEALETQFLLAKRSNKKLCLIYYDLDHFKTVNDTYGHAAGDQVLLESASNIKKIIRKNDILGRVGGEEFMIILPDFDIQKAVELAESIRKVCEGFVHTLNYKENDVEKTFDLKQTISLGVSCYIKSMETTNDLIQDADKKLYISKGSGRNKVTS
ncbi:MAG: GGDEF domain-containing protein [Zetaproteobacteria bacterium]|nr:GGDEF domain-containing protein [Pseudobdellovibrionaceae bacterium]